MLPLQFKPNHLLRGRNQKEKKAKDNLEEKQLLPLHLLKSTLSTPNLKKTLTL
jgi:hypothetical protein